MMDPYQTYAPYPYPPPPTGADVGAPTTNQPQVDLFPPPPTTMTTSSTQDFLPPPISSASQSYLPPPPVSNTQQSYLPPPPTMGTNAQDLMPPQPQSAMITPPPPASSTDSSFLPPPPVDNFSSSQTQVGAGINNNNPYDELESFYPVPQQQSSISQSQYASPEFQQPALQQQSLLGQGVETQQPNQSQEQPFYSGAYLPRPNPVSQSILETEVLTGIDPPNPDVSPLFVKRNTKQKADFSQAQTSTRFIRPTTQCVPNSPNVLNQWVLPFGAICQPLAPHEHEPPVAKYIVRCSECRAYINPFVLFLDNGSRWKCNMCNCVNSTPQGYYQSLDEYGMRTDISKVTGFFFI